MAPSAPQAGDFDLSAPNAVRHLEALRALSAVERLGWIAIGTLPGLVAYWSPGLVLQFANEAYETQFGCKPGAPIGVTMRDLLGERLFALEQPYALGAAGGQYQQFQRPPGADGQTPYLSTIYVPDIVGGKVAGFLSQTIVLKEMERVELLAKIGLKAAAASLGRSASPVMDDRKMEQLVELMGREWVARRLDQYLTLIEHVVAFTPAAPELAKNIHSLMGMAGHFGFMEFLDLCTDIQHEIPLGSGLSRIGELRSAGERCRAAARSRPRGS